MLRQREPRRRDGDYLKWVRRLPCVGCAARGLARFGCEAAHVKLAIAAHGWREGGLQEKSDDRKTVGLCPGCHRTGPGAQHRVGERKFWAATGICPACLCEALGAAYEAGASGVEVIWTAVRHAHKAPTDHL